MAGNARTPKEWTMSSDFADEINSTGVKTAKHSADGAEMSEDLVNISEYSLFEQLDYQLLKIEQMLCCLELLERQLQTKKSQQTIINDVHTEAQTSDEMEKSKKSGIPIPKRVTHKEEQTLSPPLSPKEGAVEESNDQMEEDDGCTASVSVKSAARMFGGQAVIRRIPTPNSRRRENKPPPKVPPKKEKFLETNVDDIFDQPMQSLSEINGISEAETYDNVDDIENIPSYEEFIYGNARDVESQPVESDKDLAKSPPLESSEMDYTILGTISPLNDVPPRGDKSLEEMSFVLGRPASPMSPPPIETGLKRCLSPPYEPPRPLSPTVQVVNPTKRIMGNRNRSLPPLPPSRRREAPQNQVGIMCEGCNNCLLELKRQALRLMYSENSQGEAVTVPVESIGNFKDKLQVPENGYRFQRTGVCDVCDTHVNQLKQEAVTMVQSIQHAQSESVSATNIPQLIGSINLSPRKGALSGVPHVRYGRSPKYISGNYLSKSAPIAAQAQAYLEQNVRPWNVPRKFGQMLMRQSQQDKVYAQGGDMYPQGQDNPNMAQFGRPSHYAVSGTHFLSTPYMQQPHSMQVFHPQPQVQHHYQQQFHHQQSLQQQQQQHYSHQPLNHQQLLQQYQHLQPNPQHFQPNHQQNLPQSAVIQQQPQQYQPQNFQHYPQFSSQSAPGSPIRVQSPPPRMTRISSPPPSSSSSMHSLRSAAMSPPPSASAAASFFARAAQKLSKKKKRHHQPEPEPPPFPTSYSEILRLSPPPCPPCLLRSIGRQQAPGVGKVKVMLRIVATNNHGDQAASFLTIDTRNKQVTVHDPAASGYATNAAHRKAAMAPKMFAFDAVFSPDDCLTEVCSGSLTEIIQGVVAGADGCVFTYGYSKLGKTYTMIGQDSGPQTLGIVPCAIAWLFKLINEQKDHTGARFSVRVSAVEVSGKQEILKDLLADVAQGTETGVATAPGVYLREDPISGTQLENQSELRAPTADRAAYYLDAALAARTQSEDEGRSSHLLFTLHVYQYRIEKENKAGLPGVAGGRSRLHLIDLGSSSKSKDPNNVALSLSALGNVIMALLNGQRHVPHRDSKVAQLLRDSLGNISCRTCMIAHVSEAVPHYNESLQVVQLAARIHRMRRRKVKQFSNSSDDSSTDGSSIRSRPLRGFRMGTLREDALSDPDYTSSSEQSCDTVIYLGRNGQSLSDRELTDQEGPPRSVPRTNPRLPRRASGSRSSGDEGSNSDSGRSLYRSKESLYRIPSRLVSPVRDVSVTGSRQGTPIRDLSRPTSRNTTPVREQPTAEMNGHLSSSPPSVSFNLPRKSPRTKTTPPRQDASNSQCYASVSIVDKGQKSGVRIKRLTAEKLETEQWIDGPGAPLNNDKLKNPNEQWIDGPASFVVKSEPKSNSKSGTKISSEEMWIDGPREMIAEPIQAEMSPSRTPNVAMHTGTKRAHVRSLSAEKKSPSPQGSPAHHHRSDRVTAKPSWPLQDIKERPESTISMDSNVSNTAQASDSRPVSMEVHNGEVEDIKQIDTTVKPFVRDWVEKHGLSAESEMDKSIGFIMNSEEQLIGTLDTATGSYRKSKPLDSRTKKLVPASSTPKHSPHHSPKTSPAIARKSKTTPPKIHVPKSQLPAPSNPSKRVTDWLRSVEHNQPEEVLYMEGIVGKQVMFDPAIDKEHSVMMVENVNDTQDVSTCSSVVPETLNDSVNLFADVDSSLKAADTTVDGIADVSFDSSVDTANSLQNRESIYEQQVDEQLEKDLEGIDNKLSADIADDDSFSNASYSKESDSEGASDQPFVENTEKIGDMMKSDTMQSIKTLVGELANDNGVAPQSDISEKVCNDSYNDPYSVISDIDGKPHLLSRKPDGASNPNLTSELYTDKTAFSALREEYTIVNTLSSQPEVDLKSKMSYKSTSTSLSKARSGEADGQPDDKCKKDKVDFKQINGSKPPLPQNPCSKCGYSPQTAKTMSKLCKDCQKMVTMSIKNSHKNRTEKDKSVKHNTSSSSNGSPSSACATKTSKPSKSQSPSQSRLPIFSKNCQTSLKDAKSNRKKEKENKKFNISRVNELVARSPNRGHESDSGNDSGIVAMEKTLLSPYATVTKPRTVSHSSSGHGSDNSSTMSTDLQSKQGSTSDKLHGGTSSGYESMLRDSENSGSSTAHEESASEVDICDKKKGSKKRRVPSTRRSRSAPARSSESPETSSSRKSSPSSKNSSLSPSSKAWIDRHKMKEEVLEIKDYDQDDLKRMNRHRPEDETQTLRMNHDKLKEILNNKDQEIPNGKDQFIVDRNSGNWSFDCRFFSCFSCRSKSHKKTDV